MASVTSVTLVIWALSQGAGQPQGTLELTWADSKELVSGKMKSKDDYFGTEILNFMHVFFPNAHFS